MNRHQNLAFAPVKGLSPVGEDPDARAEHGLACGGSEPNDQARSEESELPFEPGPAGFDFVPVGLLVEATPAGARFSFEVLDDIGHVHLVRVDPSLVQR